MKRPSSRTNDPRPRRSRFCPHARRILAIAFIAVTGGLRSVPAAPPPFEWTQLVGTVNDDYGRALAVDPSGNTYITGSIDGTATFGSTNITSSGGSNRPDIFVAKYDAAGQFLWVRKAGGTGTDLAFGIAVDGSGNVVVTGSSDSVPFGIGSTNIFVSSKKVVFLKFDSAGALIWVRTSLAQAFFPPPDGSGVAAGADAAGNLYFAGHFTGPINFGGTAGTFPPPTGGIAFTNNAENDVFLLKYSPAGSIIWGRQIGGDNLQEVRGMAVTPSGDVFLAGRFNGTATFASTNLTSGNGSWDTDAYLAKWDTDGNFRWVRQVGSNDTDLGLTVAVDTAGASHLIGAFKGQFLNIASVTYTNSDLAFDGFVVKYNAAGVVQWSMPIERPAGTTADEGLGAAIDRDGNLLIAGVARTGTKFKNLSYPEGTGSIFVALIENGDTVWVKRAGTVGGTVEGDFGVGIGQDRADGIYLGGTLGVNDPGSLAVFDSITPTIYGRRDIFVAKLGGAAPPNAPTLSFSLTGPNLSVSWPLANADFNLESSTNLGSGFGQATEERVTNTVAQIITVTILPTGAQKFYRMVRP